MSHAPPSLISSHIKIAPTAEFEGRTKAVIEAIDSVHRDGEIGIASVAAHSDWLPTKCGRYDLRTKEIGMNSARHDHEQTLAHEIGHLVAVEGLGGGKPICAKSPELGGWRQEVLDSETHKSLVRLKNLKLMSVSVGGATHQYNLDPEGEAELDYLLLWEELWARSYCQFIAVRSGNQAMLEQIAAESASDYGKIFSPHWPVEDFEGIENAIESVMKGRGWM